MEEGPFTASGARRVVETDDGRWIALEAWRGRDGRGLCYFLRASDRGPEEDDRGDRRAVLEPDSSLEESTAAELEARVREAAALTATERRFADARGALWLAQNVGPVWAAEDVAAGLTGILFTRLTGRERVRVSAPGGHGGGMEEDDLRSRLQRALRRREASAEEGTARAGDGPGEGRGGREGALPEGEDG